MWQEPNSAYRLMQRERWIRRRLRWPFSWWLKWGGDPGRLSKWHGCGCWLCHPPDMGYQRAREKRAWQAEL
jgi:hypothetical protein